MSKNNSHYRKGFTITELLIVIGIFFVLAVAALPIYGNFQSSTQINQYSAQITQSLRTARELSMSRYQGVSYGVYFSVNPTGADSFTVYQGATYSGRTVDFDRTKVLDTGLSLTTTLAGNEVNFAKSTGTPSSAGTITLTSPGGSSKTLTINSLGLVSE